MVNGTDILGNGDFSFGLILDAGSGSFPSMASSITTVGRAAAKMSVRTVSDFVTGSWITFSPVRFISTMGCSTAWCWVSSCLFTLSVDQVSKFQPSVELAVRVSTTVRGEAWTTRVSATSRCTRSIACCAQSATRLGWPRCFTLSCPPEHLSHLLARPALRCGQFSPWSGDQAELPPRPECGLSTRFG